MISSVIDIDWMVDLTTQDIIERLAFSQIGKGYLWGGQNPMAGFDCSGFVIWLLQQVGLFPLGKDMTANDMWTDWHTVMVDDGYMPLPCTPYPPVICAFYDGDDNGSASHVMLCIGDGLVIGACGDAGVCVRPLHYRDDFLGFAAPRG